MDNSSENTSSELIFNKEGVPFDFDFKNEDVGHTIFFGTPGTGKTFMDDFFAGAKIITKD